MSSAVGLNTTRAKSLSACAHTFSGPKRVNSASEAARLEINEKLALREEIAEISMSEEIVGASRVLREVLAGVAKVAPTDSTVLLLGRPERERVDCPRYYKQSQRPSHPLIRFWQRQLDSPIGSALVKYEPICRFIFGI